MLRPAALSAVALLAALPSPAPARGFRYGVASAEITPTTALLWTRADSPGAIRVQVAQSPRFRGTVTTRRLSATPATDQTVQVVVHGLEPSTRYWFRFVRPGATSETGAFVTAPRSSAPATIRFAFTGDADATPGPNGKPYYNRFQTYGSMARAHNAFNVNLGDTIYSDSEVGADVAGGVFKPEAVALTVPEKDHKYQENLALANLRRVRAAAGMYNQWDDHEFINDFTPAENGGQLYEDGMAAFRRYMPVTFSRSKGIYRTFRWGKALQVFLLDERSFRSAKASANHACDNPQTGQPDLAPLLPQDKRNLFALIAPSLSTPVTQQCLDTIADPGRHYIGQAQMQRFLADIRSSTATFKVILSETPISMFYALPYDFWEGYSAERTQLLDGLEGLRNVVVMSTDHHANVATDIRRSTFPSEGGLVSTGIREFVTGPVATRTFGKEFDSATGRPGAGKLAHDAFLAPPPPNGLGFLCAQIDEYGYAQVSVTTKALTVAYRDQNGRPMRDGNRPCGPFVIKAA